MTNRKKTGQRYRFRCPVCGLLAWENRLKNSYPLELIKVKSNGRCLIKNLFFTWDCSSALHSLFQRRFYKVIEYLLGQKYIDAKVVKNLAELYLKAPDIFHPDVIFAPEVVYNPEVVYSPKLVE